ncbi:vWFA domain containing protein [uncultured Caudovirales phage]|uniref:VWFA domain containing protein n=1 Tax=uncultured Caudovirales phage TaxID=2100421 RepID=A0A6J5NZ94_9CAUD|nr:vWFA domain containing protein [uncultured Caudovirales phage]
MTMTFVNAVRNQEARTENGMKARLSTASALTDLFFKIGASRGKNIIPDWTAARVQNPELAGRIALWVRDIRSGAGERKLFRDILAELVTSDTDRAIALMRKVPELGRWDDVLVPEILANSTTREVAFGMIKEALEAGNGLCAKWMPRKGVVAHDLRDYLGWAPKRYRKTLVSLTKVVETQMCANQWDDINFNHVPSVAGSRYKKAFSRHTEKYAQWTSALVSTDPKVKETVKVNAGAVYPYDVLKGLGSYAWSANYNKANLQNIEAQWNALPNFVGDANILPLVDVSGSMTYPVGPSVSAMDVAVSLGLYLADKNKGKFKDTFLTFSDKPQLLNLQGNIIDKVQQMVKSEWGMSTNLHAALDKILSVATKAGVPQEEMPSMLLILSDMQFNSCVRFDDSAIQMIRRKYDDAGYNMPAIVFWNLNAKDNVPVKHNEQGVALVSGFSPSIVKSVLSTDMDQFTPDGIMMKTIMNERYNY